MASLYPSTIEQIMLQDIDDKLGEISLEVVRIFKTTTTLQALRNDDQDKPLPLPLPGFTKGLESIHHAIRGMLIQLGKEDSLPGDISIYLQSLEQGKPKGLAGGEPRKYRSVPMVGKVPMELVDLGDAESPEANVPLPVPLPTSPDPKPAPTFTNTDSARSKYPHRDLQGELSTYSPLESKANLAEHPISASGWPSKPKRDKPILICNQDVSPEFHPLLDILKDHIDEEGDLTPMRMNRTQLQEALRKSYGADFLKQQFPSFNAYLGMAERAGWVMSGNDRGFMWVEVAPGLYRQA